MENDYEVVSDTKGHRVSSPITRFDVIQRKSRWMVPLPQDCSQPTDLMPHRQAHL